MFLFWSNASTQQLHHCAINATAIAKSDRVLGNKWHNGWIKKIVTWIKKKIKKYREIEFWIFEFKIWTFILFKIYHKILFYFIKKNQDFFLDFFFWTKISKKISIFFCVVKMEKMSKKVSRRKSRKNLKKISKKISGFFWGLF